MRIGLRVLSNPAWMGGVHYVLTWAKALGRLPASERPEVFFLYTDEPSAQVARQHSALATDARPFAEARRLDLDLVYPATQVFEAPFDAPWAGWIPDWQCKHLPEMFDEFERARRDAHYRQLATGAPALALSSQMAWDDTVRVVGAQTAPMLRLPFPAMIDPDAAAPPAAETLRRLRVPERFLLVCNQFWKHKNHIVVFRALARLNDPNVACVFTGDTTDHRWPDYFREIERIIAEARLESSVFLLGRVAREDQLALMRSAVDIIQPSRFEGWSTVVEEARALGKGLLLSRFPVHVEQSPPGSRFFDPDDDAALATLMRESWDRPPNVAARPVAAADHEVYVLDCARRFLQLARTAAATFDAQRHDPKVLLAELLRAQHARVDSSRTWRDRTLRRLGLRRRAAPSPSATAERLWEHSLSGMRMMLKADPDQAGPFLDVVRRRAPELVPLVEGRVPRAMGA